MKGINTSPPSGARDFLPEDVKFREEIFASIKGAFEGFGFVPIDTPAFERIEVLMGKYGAEAEKLIYKILKRGKQAETGEVDLALRYDLTIPFARVVTQYRNELPSIFKRYQIGPVWRADRPGRGRFREFYQCDIDIVGTASRIADAEIILALSSALNAVGVEGFTIKLNSRKALIGLLESYNISENLRNGVLVALDKLDKIGVEGVGQELNSLELSRDTVKQIVDDILAPDAEAVIRERLRLSEMGREGLAEVDEIISLARPLLKKGSIAFSPFLARGLDYYTGFIFEIFGNELGSSIASGGRYDNLLSMFSKTPTPACGGSLGIERIIMLIEADGSRKKKMQPAQVFVAVWNDDFRAEALRMAAELRDKGLKTEVYLGTQGIGRQLKYASEKGIPFSILFGPDEATRNEVAIKNMQTGQQVLVPRDRLIAHLLGELELEG